ncbi:MAG: VIT and VWA domain-containing protein [Sinimarinibacterium sp.]|jgi:Ca-activated chloride channel family protein
MRNRLLFFCTFVLLLFLLPALGALAAEPRLGGTIEASVDGKLMRLPTLKTDVDAQIAGDLATVTVVQIFANPGERPLHATYLFPLQAGAAVYEMWMEVGGERIRAQIQETQQAEQTFARAQAEGRAAALLKEHRPNMFTQQIANLMPGLPVRVTLRYVQTVPKIDGAYELVVPLVVGPRFQPPSAEARIPETAAPLEPGTWSLQALPAYPPVFGLDLPAVIDEGRVSLRVEIDGGLPINAATSATHAITTRSDDARRWTIGLQQGRVIDNRDFVLRYQLAGRRTDAGLLVHRDARGGFFSLLIEPPAAPADDEVTSREMVFLLDCSGSMDGLPLRASKAFMRAALRRLRPTDSFRIIRFSDDATEFSDAPLAATPDNIARGIEYTDQLRGEGGTMMSTGIRRALETPVVVGTKRIVTFLTDGYIGNEAEILAMVHALLGDARLYALGVGTGVNRYLLDEIGRAGRGFTRYMDPTEDVDAVADELADRLQSPVLTDLSIDWNGLAVSEVMPARIPDLFAGQSIRIQGRYVAQQGAEQGQSGQGSIRIHGQSRGRAAELLLPVTLPQDADREAVALTWARAAVAEAMYQMNLPAGRYDDGTGLRPSDAELQRRVTELGLQFALVTRWTSFVAVSEQIYNATPETSATAPVPLPPVLGVTPRAYGSEAPAFVGVAGPEASTLAALVVMLLAATVAVRRRSAAVT